MGKGRPSRAMVAAIAGWRVTSGHLKNVAGALRGKGLIEYPAEGLMALTVEGIRSAPLPEERQDVFESLRDTLTGHQRLVVDTLRHGGRMSRERLCQSVGWEPTSGHVKNVLGSLRTLEVVEYPNPGEVELTQWLAAEHGEIAKRDVVLPV